MRAKDFIALGQLLHGETRWKEPFAKSLGLSRHTINAVVASEPDAEVPLKVALAAEGLKARKREELSQ